MKNKKHWLMIGSGLIGVTLLVFIALQGKAIEVEMATVSQQDIREYIVEDAKTRLNQDFMISMPISGRLKPITLREGDMVQEGDILARLDDYQFRQQLSGLHSRIQEVQSLKQGVDINKPKAEDLKVARLQIDEARLNLTQTEKQVHIVQLEAEKLKQDQKRQQTLLQEGVVSQASFDEINKASQVIQKQLAQSHLQLKNAQKQLQIAQTQYQKLLGSVDDNEYQRKTYQAQTKQIQTQLNITRDDLNHTVIHSPVSGPILEVYIKNQQVLNAGTNIMRLGDMGTIAIETDILSEEISRIKVGQAVEISGKALDDKIVMGKVSRIYPTGFTKVSTLGVEQQRVKVLIDFDNKNTHLRPATGVDIKIITRESKNAVSVPERALFKQDGKWFVFKVQDGKAHIQVVGVGLKNDDWAEIRTGLTVKDIIVKDPGNKLEPGIKVKEKRP